MESGDYHVFLYGLWEQDSQIPKIHFVYVSMKSIGNFLTLTESV